VYRAAVYRAADKTAGMTADNSDKPAGTEAADMQSGVPAAETVVPAAGRSCCWNPYSVSPFTHMIFGTDLIVSHMRKYG
jgi:hypothetical protein